MAAEMEKRMEKLETMQRNWSTEIIALENRETELVDALGGEKARREAAEAEVAKLMAKLAKLES